MLIILSGQFVGQELSAQFGRLPPCLLPIGNKRLLELQIEEFGTGHEIVVSFPVAFDVPVDTQLILEQHDVRVVRTEINLSVTEAIATVLSEVSATGPLEILFGDTLVRVPEQSAQHSDYCVVSNTPTTYSWAHASFEGGRAQFSNMERQWKAVCGHFRFADAERLACAAGEKDLVAALQTYADECGMALVDADEWLDFGHLATFYQSRRNLLTARSFNNLVTDGYALTKSSEQSQKILAEAMWYEELPSSLVLHTPRYLGRTNVNYRRGYTLEYLYCPALSDLVVFGALNLNTWRVILDRSLDLLEKFKDIRPEPQTPEASEGFAEAFHEQIWKSKIEDRFSNFCVQRGIDQHTVFHVGDRELPPLKEILSDTLDAITPTKTTDVTFWHGDLFFGNMFFDFNSNRVMMIDPRGQLFDGTICQYGDWRYDLGKLAHSILGRYDAIIAGQAHGTIDPKNRAQFTANAQRYQEDIAEIFLSECARRFDIRERELRALSLSMFLSMLPLHADDPDRQTTLFVSALAQYAQLKDYRP